MTVPVVVGAALFRELASSARKKDSYQPNDLPPIDESFHTEEMIEELQKRALQLD